MFREALFLIMPRKVTETRLPTAMTKYEWLKVSWNKNYAPHYLPCCPHLDNPNMLLMLGVPPYAADEHFNDFLQKYGKVVQVMSQDRPSAVPKFHIPNDSKYFRDSETTPNFRCVFVQFLEEAGINSFLTNCKQVAYFPFQFNNNPINIMTLETCHAVKIYVDHYYNA